MKYRYAIAIALAAIATSACSKNADQPEQVFATVNGETITTKEFESMVHMLSNGAVTADKLTPEQRKMVIDRLVVIHVAAADALKKGMDKDAETAATLKMMRMNVLSSAAIKQYMDKLTVSDADIQTEYNSKYGAPTKEFKASHILVKVEKPEDDAKALGEAKALIEQLKKGADFAELAKKHSADLGSGKNGGELGWFPGKQMVQEFTAALETLQKGQMTETPVKSQFGYHIIKLEDTRETAPPALTEVKAQIENTLKQQKFQKYLEDLRANAKVEFKNESSSSSSSSSVSSSSVSSAAK